MNPNGFTYFLDGKQGTLAIYFPLLKKGKAKVATVLLDFIKNKGADHYELVFYSSEKEVSSLVTPKMLEKAKSPSSAFIVPPHIQKFNSNGPIDKGYVAKTYDLKSEIEQTFWSWSRKHLFDIGVHSLEIFTSGNEKIAGIYGQEVDIYNLTEAEVKKIAKELGI